MLPTHVLHGFLARLTNATAQIHQLLNQHRIVEQRHTTTREYRQRRQVELARAQLCWQVSDAVLGKGRRYEISRISVAHHLLDAPTLQMATQRRNARERIKRRTLGK